MSAGSPPAAGPESLDWRTLAAAVAAAAERLQGLVLQTPVVPCGWLSRRTGAEVRLKLENLQSTGSFKLRGATHALLRLSPAERARGVVAASSGNHGLGIAAAAAAVGVAATILVPSTTPLPKREAIAALGAEVRVFGSDCVMTEAAARREAAATGRACISPYNDAEVMAGQGSVAVELLRQWPQVEVVYVAVGGGGLLSGMAAYARQHRPEIEWVACSPAASPAMATCVRQGRIVEVDCQETWSDSTAGGVEPGALTFPLCQALATRWIDVAEDAIAAALRDSLHHQHLLLEGAAGVALAACLQDRELRGRRAAVIACGSNLPLPLLRRLLAEHG